MSAKERRRRPPPPVKVKVAFGDENDDDNPKQNNREMLEDFNPSFANQYIDKTNDDVELDRSYEKAFFTIHNTTVEVVLENDLLSWSTVLGENSHEETSRRKNLNRDNTNSVNLQDVYAISPIHTCWNWSLNVNENIAGTTVSTSNTISAPPVSGSSTLSQTSVLRGFQLHSYQHLEDNILQEILIIFQSNASNLIDQWYQLLSKIISEHKPSRNILVICNPYAGPRHSRHIYNTKLKTMLERAHYKTTYLEIDEQYSADEAINNFEGDFDSLDGLVIIGGDGSVINVINALIRYLAKENRTRLDMENDLPSLPFPICIVPDGTTNIICHSIQGNTDHCTPILNLLFNRKMKIDMSAIFDIDYNFVTANFSTGAGFPANVFQYFPRYSLHSPRTIIKKSFSKAASNKNLRPIEMEIRYVPANQNNLSTTRCYRGCPLCTPEATEKSDDQVKAFDDSHIQKISKRNKSLPSNNDNNNRLNQRDEKEKNWKTLHQEYFQIAILTNANLWSFAPQGLSKFAHLADGLLDLILIEPTSRKEFLRYVKRNGNSKNQHDFPFTKLIKVKEIEIELKFTTDNFLNEISNIDNQLDSSPSDGSSNEDMSDNEDKLSGIQRHQPRPPSAPLSENSRRNRRRVHQPFNEQTQESHHHTLQSSKSMDVSVLHFKNRRQRLENETDSPPADPYGSTNSLRRSNIFQSLKGKKDKLSLPRPLSARGGEPDEEKQQRKARRLIGGTLRPARSLLNLLSGGNSSAGKTDKSSTRLSSDSFSAGKTDKSSMRLSSDSFSTGIGKRPPVLSRSSSIDNSKASKLNDVSRNKKRPCMWNLDFSPYNSPLIRIKCFYRFLPVFGVGLDPDTKIKEVNYSCFGRMG